MKFKIKNVNGKVLYSRDCDSFRECVESALRKGVSLRHADLRGADLRGADMSGADLRSANLSGADLSHADLSYADMRDANMRGADLSYADMSGANLRGAGMRGACMRSANMRGTDMSGADLSYADMSGANLRGAGMRGACMSGVYSVALLGQPNGWENAFTYLYKGEQRVQIGCRNFTLAEGRQYWLGKPDRLEVLAALDFAETIARIRGWGKK